MLLIYQKFLFSPISLNNYFWVFVIIVFSDIIMGTAKSIYLKNFTSKDGIRGASIHFLILLTVFITYPLMKELNIDYIMNIFILPMFILSYSTSILANLECMGFPVPDKLKSVIQSEIDKKKGKR